MSEAGDEVRLVGGPKHGETLTWCGGDYMEIVETPGGRRGLYTRGPLPDRFWWQGWRR